MEPNKTPEKPKPSPNPAKKQPNPPKPVEVNKPVEKRQPLKEIIIEVCANCAGHKWCTRHDETKYNGMFEEVKKAIQEAIGGEMQITKNLNIKKPKIGAFEVTCNGIVIFSKIKSGLFPVPGSLAQRVKLFVTDYNSGKDVAAYSTIEEKKYSPPKKKITQTSLDWNAKYEELKKSQLSAKKEKANKNNENNVSIEKDKEKEHEPNNGAGNENSLQPEEEIHKEKEQEKEIVKNHEEKKEEKKETILQKQKTQENKEINNEHKKEQTGEGGVTNEKN